MEKVSFGIALAAAVNMLLPPFLPKKAETDLGVVLGDSVFYVNLIAFSFAVIYLLIP